MSAVFLAVGERSAISTSASNISGVMGGSVLNTTADAAAVDVQTAGTLSNLTINVSAKSGTITHSIRSRVNGAFGNQILTVSSAVGITEDASNTDAIAAGNEFNIRVTRLASSGQLTYESMAFLFTPTSLLLTPGFIGSGAAVVLNGTADLFYSLANLATGTATEDDTEQTFATSGTLQNAFAVAATNSRSDSTSLGTRINNNPGNAVLTWAAAATGEKTDVVNTDAIANGDEACWMWNQNGGSGNFSLSAFCIEFSATNAWQLFANSAVARSANTSTYVPIAGRLSLTGTVGTMHIKTMIPFTWSNLYTYCSAFTLNSGGITTKSDIDGSPGNLTTIHTATGQQSDVTNTDVVADDALIAFNVATGGTSGSATLRSLSSLGSVEAWRAPYRLPLLGVG